MVSKRGAAAKLISLTYWSPSAGNLLSSLVWALGADLRVRTDAIKVLRLVSSYSRDEIADLIGDDGGYRRMDAKDFAGLRAEAVDTVMRCIDAARAERRLHTA